jgi:hypothetical protein
MSNETISKIVAYLSENENVATAVQMLILDKMAGGVTFTYGKLGLINHFKKLSKTEKLDCIYFFV